jgi:thioredoxin-like negative regulator of GroEL
VTGRAKNNPDKKTYSMAEQSFIFDGNEENLDALVIENSTPGPVLVIQYRKQMMNLMF